MSDGAYTGRALRVSWCTFGATVTELANAGNPGAACRVVRVVSSAASDSGPDVDEDFEGWVRRVGDAEGYEAALKSARARFYNVTEEVRDGSAVPPAGWTPFELECADGKLEVRWSGVGVFRQDDLHGLRSEGELPQPVVRELRQWAEAEKEQLRSLDVEAISERVAALLGGYGLPFKQYAASEADLAQRLEALGLTPVGSPNSPREQERR